MERGDEALSPSPRPSSPPPAALSSRLVAGVVVELAAHPSLWGTALRQAARLASPGWWRRGRLPVPSGEYVAFRIETMYGDAGTPSPDDVVTWLRWCRSLRRALG